MALLARTQSRARLAPRLLVVAAVLAVFATVAFSLRQAPVASAAGPSQPTDSQFYLGYGYPYNYNYNYNYYNNYNYTYPYYNSYYNYPYYNNYNYSYPYYNNYSYSYPYYNSYNSYPYYNYSNYYNSYAYCGNSPGVYSYPASYTCPITPLNNTAWNPFVGYPYIYVIP